MGRLAKGSTKTEFLKIRITPELDAALETAHSLDAPGTQKQDYAMTVLWEGLRVMERFRELKAQAVADVVSGVGVRHSPMPRVVQNDQQAGNEGIGPNGEGLTEKEREGIVRRYQEAVRPANEAPRTPPKASGGEK